MKPVLLEIQAFGPYSDLQVIDFTLLEDVNMFLIHGPTGGGKTTILDAISYALYGDTSGNERDGESMRSDFAKEEVLTQVKFEFMIRESTYFIHRIPGQERPKKVGDGTTYQNPKAELYEIKEDSSKRHIASGINKVALEIVDIIGFDSDQFRQVIMIPQGQFRELLTAKSEARQKILGDIFQTNKYKRVEERIRSEHRELRDGIITLKNRRDEQIKTIKSEGNDALKDLMDMEYIDAKQVLKELDNLFSLQDKRLKTIEKDINLSDKKIEENNAKLSQAKINKENYDKKIKKEKEYKEFKSKEEEYKTLDENNKLSQKALPIKELELYVLDIKKQGKTSKDELEELEDNIKKLSSNYKKLEIQLEKLKEEEPEIEKTQAKVYKYENDYLQKVKNLGQLVERDNKLQLKIKEDNKKNNQAKKNLEKLKKDIVNYKNKIKEKDKLVENLSNIKLKVEKNKTLLVNKKEQINFKEELETMLKDHKKLTEKLKETKKQYKLANKEHGDALDMWLASQTSELSKKLEIGRACPVCGSTKHPSPAKESKKSVTQEEVTLKKDQADEIHKKLIMLDNERIQVETEGRSYRNNLKRVDELLKDYKDVSLESILTMDKENKIKQKNIEKSLEEIKQIEEGLEKQEENKEKVEKDIRLIEKDLIKKEENYKVTLEEIKNIKTQVPESLQDIKAIESQIKFLKEKLLANKRESERIKNEFQDASKEIQKQKGSKEVKTLQVKQTEKDYEKAVKSFKERIEKAGFESIDQYKSSYKREDEIEEINNNIKEYYNKLNIIKDQYKKLEKETKNIKLVSIDGLEKQYNEENELNRNLRKKHQNIHMQKKDNEKQKKIIEKSNDEINKKEKRYSIVGNLYDAVRGKNNKGLSFERFVQSALFDDILIRANERLVIMSSNRYELYRSHNRESKAAQSGLDMEVLDTYTGKMRHVNTLSGGEGFMASLSLALGMADVVQSYAGGIALDTMFIDEGFGTLDAQSLDLAINTLIDLQESGRLVGIISHVPELKERIGARLEVINSQSGSSVKFHL